jgi:pyridoxine/pyridoxamine 5'-phosphate oxidase
MLNDAQRAILEHGPAVLVGAVGADGMPECSRAWGVKLVDDGRAIRFTLPNKGSERLLQHIEENPKLALAFTNMLLMESYQVKGTVVDVSAPTDDDVARAARHAELFAENAISVGVPESCHKVRHAPQAVVTLELQQLFVQTPGPGAGREVGGGP